MRMGELFVLLACVDADSVRRDLLALPLLSGARVKPLFGSVQAVSGGLPMLSVEVGRERGLCNSCLRLAWKSVSAKSQP